MPNLGTFVGSPASGPMAPPASLPPVAFARRAAAQPADPFERLRQSAARAVDEFFAAGGRGQVSASDRLVRAAAASLIAACVDPARGGLVCRACGGARSVLLPDAREAARALSQGTHAEVSAADAESLLGIVDRAMAAHAGFER